MASCADGYILLIAARGDVLEKKRIAGALRRAANRKVRCIVMIQGKVYRKSRMRSHLVVKFQAQTLGIKEK
jgi:hypothetical protein